MTVVPLASGIDDDPGTVLETPPSAPLDYRDGGRRA
jgi:hypothetical protein